MAKAYILITTSAGKTNQVVGKLRSAEGVKQVDAVTGPYDVIATVEGASLDAVGNLVTNSIHTVDGVERTLTCLAVNV